MMLKTGCAWVELDKGYATGCGNNPKVLNKGYKFCPYCGQYLHRYRKSDNHEVFISK